MKKIKEFLAILLIYLFLFQPFFLQISSASYGKISFKLKPDPVEKKPLAISQMCASPVAADCILSLSKDSLRNDQKIKSTFAKLPLSFIENRGQVDKRVKYYSKQGRSTIYFTDDEIVFDFVKTKK